MPTVVNGTTYYRFAASTWITSSGGTIAPMVNSPITLYANEATNTPLSVLNLAGQPWTPVTNSSGLLPEFLAPQYDDVIADGGSGRQNIRSSEIAERIDAIAGAAAQSALDIVEPRIAAVEAEVAGLGTLPDSTAITELENAVSALGVEQDQLAALVAGSPVFYVTTKTDADLPGAKAEAAANKPTATILFVPKA